MITKDMLLGTVVAQYPEAAEVMLEYGLHCVGCFANMYDTVEIGAKVHGMDDDEIQEMIDYVNRVIQKTKDGLHREEKLSNSARSARVIE